MRSPSLFYTLFAAALVALAAASLSTGPARSVTVIDVVRDFLSGGLGGVEEYRLTRTLAAVVLGAALGASGLASQYALRNPLADPYLLGVSSGAALGVVVAYYIHGAPSPYTIYAHAITGGLASFAVVLALGWRRGAGVTGLIVAGVSVSYTLVGAAIILLYKGVEMAQPFLWLFGTVAYVPKPILAATSALTVSAVAIMAAMSARAYTLILGDEVSESMGARVEATRFTLLASATIAVSASVAMAGPVGFIGLAAPWIARLALGARFSAALAGALLAGADLALASDITVRLVGGSTELPLAAVTALYGGPLLFYLTRRTGW